MILTEHFTYPELTFSEYAIRHGINNVPSLDEGSNLLTLADGLERVRAVLGKPISISSGYRCQKVNSAIGGASGSYHTLGLAADFTVQGMSVIDACRAIEFAKAKIQYDKVIYEYGRWIHIQFPEVDAQPRMLGFTIMARITGYVPGIQEAA